MNEVCVYFEQPHPLLYGCFGCAPRGDEGGVRFDVVVSLSASTFSAQLDLLSVHDVLAMATH